MFYIKENCFSYCIKCNSTTNVFQVVESCRVGMRKPELRIYQHALEQLNVCPEDALFLDDLGSNLKTARQMGIKTIKVSNL